MYFHACTDINVYVGQGQMVFINVYESQGQVWTEADNITRLLV